MSYMTDTSIEEILFRDKTDPQGFSIKPFDESCMTPVGYDLRVGKRYLIADHEELVRLGRDEKVAIPPNSTALIETLESVNMPRHGPHALRMSGLICSKVSKVSLGLSHISTTIDPDWRGELLIAVHNHATYSVPLAFGEKLCTAVFFENEKAATRLSEHPKKRSDVLVDLKNRLKRDREALLAKQKADSAEMMERLVAESRTHIDENTKGLITEMITEARVEFAATNEIAAQRFLQLAWKRQVSLTLLASTAAAILVYLIFFLLLQATELQTTILVVLAVALAPLISLYRIWRNKDNFED